MSQLAFGWRVRCDVPLGPFHVVDRHECRLTAHGEAHVAGVESQIDGDTELIDRDPLLWGVRQRDSRVFTYALHHIGKAERRVGWPDRPGHRRSTCRVRRARQRNVALARKQTRRGVQADPTSTWHIHLGPGMQVREVGRGPIGTVESGLVCSELHEVTRHESGCQTHSAKRLDEQPSGVAARTDGSRQRFVGRLDTRFHTHRILDVLVQPLIDRHQEVGDADGA